MPAPPKSVRVPVDVHARREVGDVRVIGEVVTKPLVAPVPEKMAVVALSLPTVTALVSEPVRRSLPFATVVAPV